MRMVIGLFLLLPIFAWADCEEGVLEWRVATSGSATNARAEVTCVGDFDNFAYTFTPQVIITDATSVEDPEAHMRPVDAHVSWQDESVNVEAGIVHSTPAVFLDSACVDTVDCATDLHRPFDVLNAESRVGTPMVRATQTGDGGSVSAYVATHADVLTGQNPQLNGLPHQVRIRDVRYTDDVGFGAQMVVWDDVGVKVAFGGYDGPARTPTHIDVYTDGSVQPVAERERVVSLSTSMPVASATVRGAGVYRQRDDGHNVRTLIFEAEHIAQTSSGHTFYKAGVAYTNGDCNPRFDAECIYKDGYILGEVQHQRGKWTVDVKAAVAVDSDAYFIEPSITRQLGDGAVEAKVGMQIADGDDDTFFGFNENAAQDAYAQFKVHF